MLLARAAVWVIYGHFSKWRQSAFCSSGLLLRDFCFYIPFLNTHPLLQQHQISLFSFYRCSSAICVELSFAFRLSFNRERYRKPLLEETKSHLADTDTKTQKSNDTKAERSTWRFGRFEDITWRDGNDNFVERFCWEMTYRPRRKK